MMGNINMINYIISAIVGAIISILTSFCNKLIERHLDNKGKVAIYRKVVYIKNDGRSMGIYQDKNDYSFVVPLWIEVHNSKNASQIIRDFSVCIYSEGKMIAKMNQINYQKSELSDNLNYYGNKGSYSFLIPENSIERFDLLFVLKKSDCNHKFDEIKITYYNNKNELVVKKFKEIKSSWDPKEIDVDKDWVELK